MLPNRVVGYSPDLARIVGGATIGLYLSQLLFLSDWLFPSSPRPSGATALSSGGQARQNPTARLHTGGASRKNQPRLAFPGDEVARPAECFGL
jgi:hypothetical protein